MTLYKNPIKSLTDAEIDENWEGCCEDTVDDAYYDRTPKEETLEDRSEDENNH